MQLADSLLTPGVGYDHRPPGTAPVGGRAAAVSTAGSTALSQQLEVSRAQARQGHSPAAALHQALPPPLQTDWRRLLSPLSASSESPGAGRQQYCQLHSSGGRQCRTAPTGPAGGQSIGPVWGRALLGRGHSGARACGFKSSCFCIQNISSGGSVAAGAAGVAAAALRARWGRWRIGGVRAARRGGLAAQRNWRHGLDRCRNGTRGSNIIYARSGVIAVRWWWDGGGGVRHVACTVRPPRQQNESNGVGMQVPAGRG